MASLARARVASQLQHGLVHLAESRGPDWLTVGDTSSVSVDRESSPDLGRARCDERVLLAVLAQTAFGHVHDLRACFGVLDLDDVHIAGFDAGLVECGSGRVDGRRVGPLDCQPRVEHLEGSKAAAS